MRPALSVEIERGARLFFPEAIPLLLPWSEGTRHPANRAYSFARPSPLLRAQKHPSTEPASPAGLGGGKISVYKKIYFRICENIFSYMRKFISLRKKIFRRAEENFSPCGRRKIFVPTQGNFYAHENKFSCARKYFFVRIEIWCLAHGREFPFGRERISLGKGGCRLGAEGGDGRRRACTLAGHREGLVCRYSLGASPMSFMYLRTS